MEVEPTLWGRVRARALEEGVKVEVVVGRALRGELAGRFVDGSVGCVTGGEPQAAERGAAMRTTDAAAFQELSSGHAPVKLTVADLRRMVAEVAPGTTLDVTASADPTRGKATVEMGSPREAERRRRAAQDRLRTHPEDASQDPTDDDKAGF